MLSGIGDAAELVVFGIPVVVDLPAVGKNLQDHLDITIMHEASDRTPIGVAPSFIPRALAGALSYVFQRRGFLTSNVAESGGFVKSSPSQSRPRSEARRVGKGGGSTCKSRWAPVHLKKKKKKKK